MTIRIPLVDVAAENAEVEVDLLEAVADVIRSGRFIGGPVVDAFERAFTQSLGVEAGAGCASGTAALELALAVLGVGPGDEVVTTPHTFVATAEAIARTGALPVFADIEPGSYTLDPAAVAAALSPRTKAIITVHLYGTPSDTDAIHAVCGDVPIVEDAAQAHLARLRDRPAGALGSIAAFSFYPAKNLGAVGDAGFICSSRPDLIDDARRLLDHGRRSKYEHDVLGFNHRLDAVQAAALLVKLRQLPRWTAHRRDIATRYDECLRSEGFKVIDPPHGAEAVYHLYVVEVANRDEVRDALASKGIETGVHYPVPLHLQPALAHLGLRRGALPVTEAASARVLSLPMDGRIAPQVVDEVCAAFLAVARPD